jgi:hypothetical protein
VRVLYAGADVREPLGSAAPEWSPQRRQAYLIRGEVIRPLSVDTTVWPPVRDASGAPLTKALPWVAVADARRSLAFSHAPGAAEAAVIALGVIALSRDHEEELARQRGIDLDLVPEPTWQFLGYDVDDGGVSGLSNCAYAPEELPVLRASWAPHLNEHGLLGRLDDAIRFRALADLRVPEHAPFLVWGLWLVE